MIKRILITLNELRFTGLGKLIEHWDVQQDVSEVMPPGNGMV
ncbi:MAG: hypothetical protein ACTHMI_03625 [Mucilaginibacter sp.]